MSVKKKVLFASGITLAILVIVYLGVSLYFVNHFFYGTVVNGENYAAKRTNAVVRDIKWSANRYNLNIIGKEEYQAAIDTNDISLVLKDSGQVDKVMESQNPLLWPVMFFKEHHYDVSLKVEYNEEALEKVIQSLGCLENEGKTDPVNAKPSFNGEKFVVQPEELGTKINGEILREQIKNALSQLQPDLDLLDSGCYLKPPYTVESPELSKVCEDLNQYLTASITYVMEPDNVVVDKALISTWLTWNDEFQVTFHEEMVREYVSNFVAQYTTCGGTRYFTTPEGREVEVTGGTYGWTFDEGALAESLLASLRAGEVIVVEPPYTQRAAVHSAQDWGSTYIDVDISAQHIWYIENGSVVFESPVVTGLPYARSTPTGVYYIITKSAPAVLVGNIMPETGKPEYRTQVDYWMPVTMGGVGFHDATWQPYFGGDRYLYAGSHGCINMPYNEAATLYSIVAAETPVVIHY